MAIWNALRRFVNLHARILLAASGAFVAICGYLVQFSNLLPKSIPAVGLLISLLPMAASIVTLGRDRLASDVATRQKEQAAAVSTPNAQARTRAAVQMAVQKIVENRFTTPLGTRLELALVRKPAEVDDPQRAATGDAPGPDQAVASGTKIIDLYTQAQGQLLILGPGGSGKSGILGELAASLLDASRTPTKAPVPVVLQLGSWRPTTDSLNDWLVSEISAIYPIDPLLVQQWLTDQSLVPLLDGLDAAGDQAAAACVRAINEFVDQTKMAIAVASRMAEYERYGTKLRFHDAIAVLPLSRAQILESVSAPDLKGVAEALNSDPTLFDLMSTPWFLGIVVSTYRGKAAESMPSGGSSAARRDQILADYVSGSLNQQVVGKDPQFTPGASREWLGWLARKLLERNQEVYYYDLMQPDLLPTPGQTWRATYGVALLIGALTGVLALVGYVSIFGALSILMAVIAGVVVGMAAYEPRIAPTTRLRWSWTQLRGSLPGWLGFGPVFGLLAGLSVLAIAELQGAKVQRTGFIISGLFAGLCLGIFFALVGALRNEIPDEPPGPGDAIRSTLTTALKGGTMMLLASAIIAGFGGGLIVELASLPHGPRGDLYYWLVPGLVVQGLAISLVLGVGGIDPGVRIGLRRSWRTSFVIGGGVAIVDAQVAAFMSGHFGMYDRFLGSGGVAGASAGLLAGLLLAVLVGIGTGICHGMLRGGGTYLRHKALLRLLRRDKVIAPNQLGFLQYASRVRLIQRRGGGYEFLHRFLLEHFAA